MPSDPTPLPIRCDYNEETDGGGQRCKSTNAKFIPSYQGNLCMVHEAALLQARRMHPAGKQRTAEMLTWYDPTEVIRILRDELKAANSREALEGYFDHLIDDDQLQRSLIAYTGEDLGTKQGDTA